MYFLLPNSACGVVLQKTNHYLSDKWHQGYLEHLIWQFSSNSVVFSVMVINYWKCWCYAVITETAFCCSMKEKQPFQLLGGILVVALLHSSQEGKWIADGWHLQGTTATVRQRPGSFPATVCPTAGVWGRDLTLYGCTYIGAAETTVNISITLGIEQGARCKGVEIRRGLSWTAEWAILPSLVVTG